MTNSLTLERSGNAELLGTRRPRISVVPAAASTALAEDMVDLAMVAGLDLDPWQADTVIGACGVRPDGLWSAFEAAVVVGRQNGKGSILEARQLGGLFLVDTDRLMIHTAHRFATTTEHFLRVRSLIENCDRLRKLCRKPRESHGEEQIETLAGHRLRFMARSRAGGRGFSGDALFFDEAMILDGRQMGALLPTLSARPNPQVWYTSSAGFSDSYQLHAVRARALALAGMTA